jgi:mRNA interferase MazF
VLRGDVHSVNLPRGRGRAQHGPRYAVIVQADELATLSTVVICPTSQSALAASFRPEIELGESKTRVLCEMTTAVDVRSLGERVGHLSLGDLAAVDHALGLVFNLGR